MLTFFRCRTHFPTDIESRMCQTVLTTRSTHQKKVNVIGLKILYSFNFKV